MKKVSIDIPEDLTDEFVRVEHERGSQWETRVVLAHLQESLDRRQREAFGNLSPVDRAKALAAVGSVL